jgi:hypothetical protein
MMRDVASTMSDEQIDAVASYVQACVEPRKQVDELTHDQTFAAAFLALGILASGAACSKQPQQAAPAQRQRRTLRSSAAEALLPPLRQRPPEESAPTAPTETVTETDDAPRGDHGPSRERVQPTLRLAAATNVRPASTSRKAPTIAGSCLLSPQRRARQRSKSSNSSGTGCSSLLRRLDPAIESWRGKRASRPYVEFTARAGACGTTLCESTRGCTTTAEALGTAQTSCHSQIFARFHVNNESAEPPVVTR